MASLVAYILHPTDMPIPTPVRRHAATSDKVCVAENARSRSIAVFGALIRKGYPLRQNGDTKRVSRSRSGIVWLAPYGF